MPQKPSIINGRSIDRWMKIICNSNHDRNYHFHLPVAGALCPVYVPNRGLRRTRIPPLSGQWTNNYMSMCIHKYICINLIPLFHEQRGGFTALLSPRFHEAPLALLPEIHSFVAFVVVAFYVQVNTDCIWWYRFLASTYVSSAVHQQ